MNIAELRHNRYLRVLFVPFRMRALVRGSEIGLVIAGTVIGIISGLMVAAIGSISQWMHQAIFALEPGEKLRSEERRVGKECRYRWSTYHQKKTAMIYICTESKTANH